MRFGFWPGLFLAAGGWQAMAADEVKFSDLQGKTIKATIENRQRIRMNGRAVSVRIEGRWTVSLRPEDSIEARYVSTAVTPRGRRKAPPLVGTFVLRERQPIRSRGGGIAEWDFADQTLTFVRTLPAGAFRTNFRLRRNGTRLDCMAETAFAREEGKGEIRFRSPITGGMLTILKSEPGPSTCTVD